MKNIKNAMSDELIEWAREKHGRFAQIARVCGVSHRQVFAWSARECGIAQRHHKKIFELAGINPVCGCNCRVSVTGNKLVTNQQPTGQ
jgi:predicted GNAT superfamily acetyltransferase